MHILIIGLDYAGKVNNNMSCKSKFNFTFILADNYARENKK